MENCVRVWLQTKFDCYFKTPCLKNLCFYGDQVAKRTECWYTLTINVVRAATEWKLIGERKNQTVNVPLKHSIRKQRVNGYYCYLQQATDSLCRVTSQNECMFLQCIYRTCVCFKVCVCAQPWAAGGLQSEHLPLIGWFFLKHMYIPFPRYTSMWPRSPPSTFAWR